MFTSQTPTGGRGRIKGASLPYPCYHEPGGVVQTSNPLGSNAFETPLNPLLSPSDEEEALDWIDNEDMKDYHKACWELEFLPVAQKLLGTLQPLQD